MLDYKKNPTILNKFLNYLVAVKNYSIGTVEGYNIDLNCFFRFLKVYFDLTEETVFNKINICDVDIFLLKRVKEQDISAFLFAMGFNMESKVNTKNRKLCSIKAFYNWLNGDMPYIKATNPAEELKKVINIQRLPKYLNLEQSRKLINIFNENNSRYYERNNFIITLFLTTGMRLSELVNIKLGDINIKEKTIKIIGKGNKERTIYLDTKTAKKLKNYITTKYGKNYSYRQYLFLSKSKKQISTRQVEYVVQKAYRLANLDEYGYTVHTLRHTFATNLYQHGKHIDILLLKELLGHSSIASTEIYTHVHNNQLKKAVENHPLNINAA